jgi:NAD(P)H-dependent FMN reductase
MLQLLAISGSLRESSSNTNLLKAVSLIAADSIKVSLFKELGNLPHFNPDLQENEPPIVLSFRDEVSRADGLIICSPEYAHGVPGVMKNALDWLVGSQDFMNKPVMLLSTSSRSIYARASLIETLSVMTARISFESSITVELWGKNSDVSAIMENTSVTDAIKKALDSFSQFIAGEA